MIKQLNSYCIVGLQRYNVSKRGPAKGWNMDPNPDYDASDEVEFFFNWLPWALRGTYPPPAYPPN